MFLKAQPRSLAGLFPFSLPSMFPLLCLCTHVLYPNSQNPRGQAGKHGILWVAEEGGSWGRRHIVLYQVREWARRRLILLISQICASHLWGKVIWGPATFSSLSSPTRCLHLSRQLLSSPSHPNQGPVAGNPQSEFLWLGLGCLPPSGVKKGSGWKWWEAPCLAAHSLAEQAVLFIFFLHLIYKIVPFPKTALGLKHNKYGHSEMAFN